MKLFVTSLARAIATFGTVAAMASLVYMILAGEPATSDDSYIVGCSTGAVVGGAVLAALVVEHFFGKMIGRSVYVALYALPMAGIALAALMATGEAREGWGMLLVPFGAAVVCGPFEFFLLRRLPLLYFVPFGSALAVAVMVMLYLTPIHSR